MLRHLAQAAWALPALSLGACSSISKAPAASAAIGHAPWATGGTAAISAAVRASNPFAATAAAGRCTLSCEATIGPCHTQSPERIDISDGWDGLPMHLQLRLLDLQCQPIAGALVEIWHTNYKGGYSGEIVRMCNNNAADTEGQFFRGWQRSDAQGIVRFDSCYPSWYASRANHIHIRILQGAYEASDAASSWLTTQLLFPDALNSAIFAQAPHYQDKGQPDTTLDSDNVVGEEPDKSAYLWDVQNIAGVMLASKTLVLRNRLDDALCQVKGKMPPGPPPGMQGGPGGPGGPGRPPPGFKPGGPRPPLPPGVQAPQS